MSSGPDTRAEGHDPWLLGLGGTFLRNRPAISTLMLDVTAVTQEPEREYGDGAQIDGGDNGRLPCVEGSRDDCEQR